LNASQNQEESERDERPAGSEGSCKSQIPYVKPDHGAGSQGHEAKETEDHHGFLEEGKGKMGKGCLPEPEFRFPLFTARQDGRDLLDPVPERDDL